MAFYQNIENIIIRVDDKPTPGTIANYSGYARPGEIVVDPTVSPPVLYIGDMTGNLRLDWGGGAGGGGNGGPVANANYANFAGSAASSNSVAGANVVGAVANATYSATAGIANSVALANVVGAGNIASINLNGNANTVLRGDGTWGAAASQYGDSNVVSLMAAFGSNVITTTGNVTGGIVSATDNGNGTNFKVGDDAWIGDINVTNTIAIRGQQNPAEGYIIFGNGDTTSTLGRSGTGPLTYSGAFTATGNVTAGNLTVNGVSNLGPNGNVIITGGTAGQMLSTDGAGNLSWVDPANATALINGTSNVVIAANGNVSTSVGGNANIFVVTPDGFETTGNANITKDLNVSGDATLNGNLTVNGNTNYINVNQLQIESPLIEMGGGPNGAPLTANDGKDRGSWMHVFDTTANAQVDKFMGWDSGNSEFTFGSNVAVANSVVSYNELGNVRAATFIGSGLTISGTSNLGNVGNVTITGGNSGQFLQTDGAGNLVWADGGNATALVNGTSNVVVDADGNVHVAIAGVDDILLVTSDGANVKGALDVTLDVTVGGDANVTGAVVVGTDLTVNGLTDLNDIGNITITGGTDGQFMKTDGSGTLVWADVTQLVNGTSNVVVEADGNITFSSAGNANIMTISGSRIYLNDVGNVEITGGSNGQFLKTDGAGNLTWSNPSGATQGVIEWVATANGTGQTFTDAGLLNISSATQCSVYVNGVLTPSTTYGITGDTLDLSRQISTGDIISVAALGYSSTSVDGAGGANTQVQYNNAGNLGGVNGVTSNGAALIFTNSKRLVVSGGLPGQVLYTIDGLGDLDWKTITGIENGNSNVNIATANGNVTISAGGSANMVTVTSNAVVLGNVGNVKISGGSNGQFLKTDGSGNLTWVGNATVRSTITITGTTTNPTKATTLGLDYISITDNGDGWCDVSMSYAAAANAAGGIAGSGTYLFTLPGGYQFDTGTHPVNTQLTNMNGTYEIRCVVPGSSGSVAWPTSTSRLVVVPHSATQFKLMDWGVMGGTGTTVYNYISSGYYGLNVMNTLQAGFRFKKA